MTLFYRLGASRVVLSATFESRLEMTQWLACMAQEGRAVHALRVA